MLTILERQRSEAARIELPLLAATEKPFTTMQSSLFRDRVMLERRADELRKELERKQREVDNIRRQGCDTTAATAGLSTLNATLEALEVRIQTLRVASATADEVKPRRARR